MTGEYHELSADEKLKAENDFLKLKMMLENGAEFMTGSASIPAEVENHFLQAICEFEKQFENCRRITVFKKINSPGHFKPVKEIAEENIETGWQMLDEYLQEYGIEVSAISPRVTKRELYRFVTEELFLHEIDDMNVPGMVCNFIYDEFYPDHLYDNERMVTEDLLEDIFSSRDLFFRIHYAKDGFLFNNIFYADWSDYIEKIESFKKGFESLSLVEVKDVHTKIDDKICQVIAFYKASGLANGRTIAFEGVVEITLTLGYLDYWEFSKIAIEGLNLI